MSGKTAAMIAASNGNTEILKALGRGPSLLNLKDADGGTAAMTAAVHHHGTVLDYVSSSPPPPMPRVSRSIAPPRAMLPPASRAPPARLRRPRSVTAESDSTIAKPENQILTHPYRPPRTLTLHAQLIEKHVDLNAVDSDGWTALMYAVTVGDAVCVAKLIEAGADASIKNNDGDTPMALCKHSKQRYNLIQIIDPKEPLPDITE